MPTPGNERNEAPPPGPLRRALRMLGGLVALPLGVLAFGTAPSCMGFGPPALALVGQCQTATAALGAPITQSYVGFSCGNAETEDDDGRASWRMPVAGSRGSGVLELDADERSGTWTFGHLVLTPSGGQPIDVLACAAGGPVCRRGSCTKSTPAPWRARSGRRPSRWARAAACRSIR